MRITFSKQELLEGKKVIRALDSYREKSGKKVFLPQLLGLRNTQAPYEEWRKALNETTRRLKNGRDQGDIEALVLCRDILQEKFAREYTWRQLLNVVGKIYIDKNIMSLVLFEGDVRHIAESYRFLKKTLRDGIGSPDAEEVIKMTMEEKGIGINNIWREIKRLEEELEMNRPEMQLIERRKELEKQRIYIQEQKNVEEKRKREEEQRQRREEERQRREEERKARNAEIQPGRWRVDSTHPMYHQASAMLPNTQEYVFRPDSKVEGAITMNMFGMLAQVPIEGGWHYDYNSKTLDLNLILFTNRMTSSDPWADAFMRNQNYEQGAMPQQENIRVTGIHGSNGVYEGTTQGMPIRFTRVG